MEQKKKEDGKLKNDVSEKEKLEMERKKLEMERQKEEMELLKKQRAERIKKRKFPMDDIKLIEEDKELNVKRPSGINKSPFLPYALTYVMPHDECSYNSNDGKTDYTITPTKRPKTKKVHHHQLLIYVPPSHHHPLEWEARVLFQVEIVV